MIEIYVVTHKKYTIPKSSIYIPIIAGASEYDVNKFPVEYIRDDTGDNISDNHDLLSEFTVNYWIWKNSHADIVGINHYRRYFIKGGWLSYINCLCNPSKKLNKYIITEQYIESLFSKQYNCILPKKQWRVNRSLKDEFVSANSPKILDALSSIIKNQYSEYYDTFTNVFDSKENYQKCICIMKKPIFDKYTEWMFEIFDKLKEAGYGGANREFAFLGERLMNVWIEYNKKKRVIYEKEHFFINLEYPLLGIVKNHTELIIPKWIKHFLKIATRMNIEVVIGNGNCKIRRRSK